MSPTEIAVDSVWPLYGPVVGGTRVTVTGHSLNVSTVTAVYIGQHQYFIDKYRLENHCISSRYLTVIQRGPIVVC